YRLSRRSSCRYGDGEGEAGTEAEAALTPDPTALQLDQPAGDVETQAGAAMAAGARAVELAEALEEVRDVSGEDAGPGVGHRNFDLGGAGQGGEDDFAFGVLEGVVDQVTQCLSQLGLVEGQWH